MMADNCDKERRSMQFVCAHVKTKKMCQTKNDPKRRLVDSLVENWVSVRGTRIASLGCAVTGSNVRRTQQRKALARHVCSFATENIPRRLPLQSTSLLSCEEGSDATDLAFWRLRPTIFAIMPFVLRIQNKATGANTDDGPVFKYSS